MTQPWPIHQAHRTKASLGGAFLPIYGAFEIPLRRSISSRLLVTFGMLCLALFSATSAEAIGLRLESAPAFPAFAANRLQLVQANADRFEAFNVTGPAGQPIPLKIVIPDTREALQDQFLIFKNVPDGFELAPGGDLGKFWAVNAYLFDKITLKSPKGFSGSFVVKVEQAGKSTETPHRSVTFTATITGPETAEAPAEQTIAETTVDHDAPKSTPPSPETTGAQAAVQTPSDETEPAVAAPSQTEEPEAHASIETPSDHAAPSVIASPPKATSPNPAHKKLMDRAAVLFGKGDISAARAVFRYLVAEGNADAAIALGGTYDPVVLSTVIIKGLEPDPEKAQYWYKKADELGSTKARSRLDSLAKR